MSRQQSTTVSSKQHLTLQISTSPSDFVRDYVELLNGIFKLTPTEVDILVEMIKIDSTKPCGTECRKQIVDVLEFKSTAILNNYIRSLKQKGVIVQNGSSRSYKYHNLIVPSKDLKLLQFSFNVHTTK